MKLIFIAYSLILFFTACNGQEDKREKKATTTKPTTPKRSGAVSTSSTGWMMKATINGTEWTASSMMPPDAAGRIIGYYDADYLGLPYDKHNLATGKKTIFSDEEVVDLSAIDNPGFSAGRAGEMEITNVNENWIEGKFHFTAFGSGSSRSIEVTNGYFRIAKPAGR